MLHICKDDNYNNISNSYPTEPSLQNQVFTLFTKHHYRIKTGIY